MTFKRKPLIYIASPYLHELKAVMQQRVREIQELTAKIMEGQTAIIPFSPIAYTGPLARLVNEDFDWYEWDFQFLKMCDGMIVAKQKGWENSIGIRKEIDFCQEHKIPFIYTDPEHILEACETINNEILRATQQGNALLHT